MTNEQFVSLKKELSLQAKNGIDFIAAATIIWLAVAVIWTLSWPAYDRSVWTFIVGGPMLPLAFLLSKLFKTNWTVADNPLQPLGLWLNIAQLFYFPFLVFILLHDPDYFVMTYAIITGAHFFPYAWFYDEKAYAVMAGVIVVGALLLGLNVAVDNMFLIPLYTAVCLLILGGALYYSYRHKVVA
ncbi:MAG TPA: hypothetical protein VLL52_17865 [Anaerolineae bacterium]|nr:hypothetical protein [Anaerolineae bacterium]